MAEDTRARALQSLQRDGGRARQSLVMRLQTRYRFPDPYLSEEQAARFEHRDLAGLDDAALDAEWSRVRLAIALGRGGPRWGPAWLADRDRRIRQELRRRKAAR